MSSIAADDARQECPETEAFQTSPETSGSPQGRAFSKLKPAPEPDTLTKFGDVKSAGLVGRRSVVSSWRRCGDRGELTDGHRRVLGCKPAVVSVARARFKLKPRRDVSGRPKVPDEPAHKIERVAFTTSRLMEFCTEKELIAQTGHEFYRWPCVVVKELVDNAIDAAEEAEVPPSIKITLTSVTSKSPIRIVIARQWSGHPLRRPSPVSSTTMSGSPPRKRSFPRRGAGRATRSRRSCRWPMSSVARSRGETWIEAGGVKHRIVFSVNQIKQEPVVQDIRSRSSVTLGTRVTVFWPSTDRAKIDPHEIGRLLLQFIAVNPHLSVVFTAKGKTLLDHVATDPEWVKYRACDATSAHWYRTEQFERYAGALIARDQETRNGQRSRKKITVREFAAQFRGMSATEKQKQVLGELGVAHMSLARFFGSDTHVNHERMKKLLTLLQKHTRPVRPELLGVVGEDHLHKICVELDGEDKSFKYFASPGQDAAGVPYVVEIATCAFKAWVAGKQQSHGRVLITGVNFSATLANPFHSLRGMQGVEGILVDLRAGPDAPVVVVVHYASPHIEYLDRGKSRIGLE